MTPEQQREWESDEAQPSTKCESPVPAQSMRSEKAQTEQEGHQALAVLRVDGWIDVVHCTCSDTFKPTTHEWARNHYVGSFEDGWKVLEALLEQQKREKGSAPSVLPATADDEQSDVRPVSGARVARYAEAMFLVEDDYDNPEDIKTMHLQIGRVMAVADSELAELRTEVALIDAVARVTPCSCSAQRSRAEAAEAKLRDVEAERDRWIAAFATDEPEHYVIDDSTEDTYGNEIERAGCICGLWSWDSNDSEGVTREFRAHVLAVLARSQAPQAPAEQEGAGEPTPKDPPDTSWVTEVRHG